MFTKGGEEFLEIQRTILNLREVGVSMGISEYILQTMELERVRDEITQQLLYRLRATVYTQSLAPDAVPVSFVVDLPVEHEWQLPRGWLDLIRLRHPRWRRLLGEPRFTTVRHTAEIAPHRIRRDVVIEREFAYPDASIVLPADRFGRPVLFEHVRTPEA